MDCSRLPRGTRVLSVSGHSHPVGCFSSPSQGRLATQIYHTLTGEQSQNLGGCAPCVPYQAQGPDSIALNSIGFVAVFRVQLYSNITLDTRLCTYPLEQGSRHRRKKTKDFCKIYLSLVRGCSEIGALL
ncbi:hypothetical protein MPH_12386 [Macrophomina phaseolina MS6]|uniref:Uncharacterized protein n=1 Tax=Macrophomina phaseolina (strain MS6) TaxID=1126212 RepID=K2R838_MACPH|nr:hypothetical protein MPH_12386 [Macrophomina phaseolina MS6]